MNLPCPTLHLQIIALLFSGSLMGNVLMSPPKKREKSPWCQKVDKRSTLRERRLRNVCIFCSCQNFFSLTVDSQTRFTAENIKTSHLLILKPSGNYPDTTEGKKRSCMIKPLKVCHCVPEKGRSNTYTVPFKLRCWAAILVFISV